MNDRTEVTACLIMIGNEILSGRTKDANLPFLAARLNEWGVRLREARVVSDDRTAIVVTWLLGVSPASIHVSVIV